jgi:DNA processing protein
MHLRTAVALSLWPAATRPSSVAIWRSRSASTPAHLDPPGVSPADVDAALERAARHGILPVPWDDVRYPAALREIVDPPPLLWVRGNPDAIGGVSVAIVGSRRASAYGLQVAERLARDLADRGIVVVSGLARGADGAAHRGAVRAGGATTAVLGSGCDVVYPAEHRALADEIVGRGAILSELPPGTPPRRPHFPRRNRLISGLSLAVVIVEAAERSGTLITARCGLDQGREVMAVPGNVLSGASRGCHALIKDGAKLVETVDDILDELRIDAPAGRRPERRQVVDPRLEKLEPGKSYDLDELAVVMRASAQELLPRLTTWELAGAIIRTAGGRFVRSGA